MTDHRVVGAPNPRHGPAAVDVVIVTYKSAAYIDDCLTSLDRALADLPNARILVVDNASGDDIEEAVAGISSRVTLIQRPVNDGFAAGCHAGAAESDAQRILFANPDAVVDAGAVQALLDAANAHPRAGIVGGRALAPDGSTDPQSWRGRPTLWSALCFATGLSSVLPGSAVFDPESADRWDGRSRDVPVVSGGMMLVERHLWDALGGFDRVYFLYGEDVDFCLRAGAAGWSPRVTSRATYRHEVGLSSAGSNRLPMVLRGQVTTYRRNLPPPLGALAGHLLVIGVGMRAWAARFRPVGGRRAHPSQAWRQSWDRRSEWRQGWS